MEYLHIQYYDSEILRRFGAGASSLSFFSVVSSGFASVVLLGGLVFRLTTTPLRGFLSFLVAAVFGGGGLEEALLFGGGFEAWVRAATALRKSESSEKSETS